MKSLKERLMFWKSGKPTEVPKPSFEYHNELLIAPGSFISLDVLDFRDRKPRVAAYNEWRQEAFGVTSRFTDYTFEGEDAGIKLRAFDDSGDKDDNVWILSRFHQQRNDEIETPALVGHLQPNYAIDPATGKKFREPFHVTNDDGTTSYFRRFHENENPHLAYTYPEHGKYQYWDFYNEHFPDQLLYVEQCLTTKDIQMWLAQRIPLANIWWS